jgi:crotonobetainyl-CoA:carnitine CoA-transferase CaiB-like acyl-CoA transferase
VAFSRSTGVAGPAPLCGQDTDAVLAELGYDDPTIASLRSRQIIDRP